MSDPLVMAMLAVTLVGAFSTYRLAAWRARTDRGPWVFIAWALVPIAVLLVPATGCLALADQAAQRDGACMAIGGMLMTAPVIWLPAWLVGLLVGLGAYGLRRRSRP